MWTIIIFAIIGLVIGLWTLIDDWFMGVAISLFSILVGGLIGSLVALALPADLEVKETTFQLETLQDNGGVEGRFFLGCGTINSKMVYVFYYNAGVNSRGDTVYRMGQVDYNDASVIYCEEKPYLLEYNEVPSDAFINNFGIDFGNTWYEIYVPRGTIKNGYTLDAQ